MCEVASTTKEWRIKGENQLEELTSLLDHISKKFDEYQEDRHKEDKLIGSLQEHVFFWKRKWWCRTADLLAETVLQKELSFDTWSYWRYECPDELVMQTIKSEMDPDVHVEDIGRTRQIYFKTKSKHCSIIVKFVKY